MGFDNVGPKSASLWSLHLPWNDPLNMSYSLILVRNLAVGRIRYFIGGVSHLLSQFIDTL